MGGGEPPRFKFRWEWEGLSLKDGKKTGFKGEKWGAKSEGSET